MEIFNQNKRQIEIIYSNNKMFAMFYESQTDSNQETLNLLEQLYSEGYKILQWDINEYTVYLIKENKNENNSS